MTYLRRKEVESKKKQKELKTKEKKIKAKKATKPKKPKKKIIDSESENDWEQGKLNPLDQWRSDVEEKVIRSSKRPTRRGRKVVSYVDYDDEEDFDDFQ